MALLFFVPLLTLGQSAPTKPNPYPAGECTAWVWFQANNLFGIELPSHLDAGDWYDGFPKHSRVMQSQTPRGRAIAVWRGQTGPECANKDSNANAVPLKCFGHVAYVKSIDSEGNAELTEANNPKGNQERTKTLPATQIPNHLPSYQFAGYLYLPRPELLFKGRTEVSQARQITVTGTHFIHNSNVRIYAVYNNVQGDLIATIQADNNGSFSWTYAPGCDNPGIHEFRAVDDDDVESNVVVMQVDGSLKCIFAPNVAHAAEAPNPSSSAPQPSAIAPSATVANSVSDVTTPAAQNQSHAASPAQPMTGDSDQASSAQQVLPDTTAPAVQNQPQYTAPVQPMTYPDQATGTQQALPDITAAVAQNQPYQAPGQPMTSYPDQAPGAQQTSSDTVASAVQNQPQYQASAQPTASYPDQTPGQQQTVPFTTAPAAQYPPQNPVPVQPFVNPDGNSSAQQTLPDASAPAVQYQPQNPSPAPSAVVSPDNPNAPPTIQPSGPIAGAPTLTLSSISPPSHAVGQFIVDVYGSGFQQGAKVLAQGQGWSSDRPPVTVIDSTHLQAVLDVKNPANFTIAVRNPDGSLSGPLPVHVDGSATMATANPTSSATGPILLSISPTTHATGQFQVDLYGSRFQQGARVIAQGANWNSDQAAVMYLAPNHLKAIIAAPNASRFTLAVRNPDGQLSTAQLFEVTLGSSNLPAKPVRDIPRSKSVQQPIPDQPANSVRTHANPGPQPDTRQPASTSITSPLPPKVGDQPVSSLPNSNMNSRNSHTTPTAIPNEIPAAPQSSVPVQKPLLNGQEPFRPLQPQAVPSNHPGSTISTTTTVPRINVPTKPVPTTQTNPVAQPSNQSVSSQSKNRRSSSENTAGVTNPNAPKIQTGQQITNNNRTQNSTNGQLRTTVPTSYPNPNPATGQSIVSKPVIPPRGQPSSTTSSNVLTTTTPVVHTSAGTNSTATNQKSVPVTTTPPRGASTTTNTYRPPTPPPAQTQQRNQQQPSNQKTPSQPTNNTNQSTTQKPSDKKK